MTHPISPGGPTPISPGGPTPISPGGPTPGPGAGAWPSPLAAPTPPAPVPTAPVPTAPVLLPPVPPAPGTPISGAPPLPVGAPSAPPLALTRRRSRLPVLATAVCLVLAVVLGTAAFGTYSQDRAPQSVVRHFFAALSAGNAEQALAFAASPPRGRYLTRTVLRQQLAVAPISDLHVGRARVSGDEADVPVRYRLRFAEGLTTVEDSAHLVRRGSSWRLDRVAANAGVLVLTGGSDRVTFAGDKLPVESQLVFPGALPLATDSPAVQLTGKPTAVLRETSTARVSVALTAAARAQVDRGFAAALTACLTGRSADPDCPRPGDTRPVPNSLRGSAKLDGRSLTAELSDNGGGLVEISGTVPVTGRWQDWNFNNQAVTRSGTTRLEVQAEASISDLAAVHWVAQ